MAVADVGVDRIVFHCMVVTTVSPEAGQAIRERITAATGIPGLVIADALAAAFPALGIRRGALLSPIPRRCTGGRRLPQTFRLGGDRSAAQGIDTNDEMARLSPERQEE
ncbi:hypothetical protein JMJ56_20840 [Belnapia sp. T18]|uniref:Uncharacterized protein n=1 Tax=Belnapia arida TaxID=2804533 RepID=A0ABS1U724_9PROT|nr:hypothetical protein [Belnapia arida]MBL6080468.1 hypothetical protein [Belnapia arida]